MKRRWRNVYARRAGKLVSIHTLPIADLSPHAQVPGCWCNPRRERESGVDHYIHNSADGRELVERHGAQ